MSLTLRVTSYQSQTLGAGGCMVFGDSGGSIGRAQDNDWTLPDPERFISGRHVSLHAQDGIWYLTDTSTNGAFLNGSVAPVGHGNAVPLNEGDRFTIGDYEIEISDSVNTSAGSYTSSITGNTDSADPLITSPTGRMDMPESLDPLDFTPAAPPTSDAGSSHGTLDGPATDPGAAPDHTPILMQSFEAPAAQPDQIPDDWDLTQSDNSGLGEFGQTTPPVIPAPTPSVTSPPVPRPSTDSLKVEAVVQPATAQVAAPAPEGAENSELLLAFLRGAGIDPAIAGQIDAAQAMESYGRLFRGVVQGLMDVLMARASLKSEFRMPLTTIRPVENNPLKFCPNANEALRNLFAEQNGGYLSPTDAIEEGFQDICNHQVAMVAGMQAAFQDMLKRFDPAAFHDTDVGGVRGALMSVNKKSRYWDAYCEFYKTAMHDQDACFQHFFGEEFARAYEEQIHRLSTAAGK